MVTPITIQYSSPYNLESRTITHKYNSPIRLVLTNKTYSLKEHNVLVFDGRIRERSFLKLRRGTALRLLLKGALVDKGLHHGPLGAPEGYPVNSIYFIR